MLYIRVAIFHITIITSRKSEIYRKGDHTVLTKNIATHLAFRVVRSECSVLWYRSKAQCSLSQGRSGFIFSRLYTTTAGSPEIGNHAVRIIGFGVEVNNNDFAALVDLFSQGNVPFWLLMNSWGDDWGEHGCFRMLRGSRRVCLSALIML